MKFKKRLIIMFSTMFLTASAYSYYYKHFLCHNGPSAEKIIIFNEPVNQKTLDTYYIKDITSSSYSKYKIKGYVPISCINDLKKDKRVHAVGYIIEDEMPTNF